MSNELTAARLTVNEWATPHLRWILMVSILYVVGYYNMFDTNCFRVYLVYILVSDRPELFRISISIVHEYDFLQRQATMDIRPNHTIYINNMNDKVNKDGEFLHTCVCITLSHQTRGCSKELPHCIVLLTVNECNACSLFIPY